MGWSEDAAQNRELWTRINAEYTDRAGAREVARGGDHLGDLGDPRRGARHHRRRCRPRRRRARLRHGVRLCLARPRAARDRSASTSPRLSSRRRERSWRRPGSSSRSSRPTAATTGLPDGELRSRPLGVRRVDLGRPLPLIPEAARLLRPGGRLVFMCGSTLSMLCCGEDEVVGEQLTAAAVRHEPHRVAGPVGRVQSSPRRAASDCSARTGSTSKTWSSSRSPTDAEAHSYYSYVTPEWATALAGRGDLGRPQAVNAPPLVLASTSPQRRAILDAARDPVRGRRARLRGVARAATRSSTPPARRARSRGRPPRAGRRHGRRLRRRVDRQATRS